MDDFISLLDSHFAHFITSRSSFSGVEKERLRDVVLALCSAMTTGHSCLPISPADVRFLLKSDVVSNGENSPLVVYKEKLYLHRFYTYERRLARQITQMASLSFPFNPPEPLFENSSAGNESTVDWQQEAAKIALTQSLTIISGGPGTGKTTTVVKIIALLLQSISVKLKIALAAPTGKAAMRLRESIGKSLETMNLDREIKQAMPMEAMTLHRLLGVRGHLPRFRHNRDNPMDWDVVVVDEASMVDLALMSKLVDGLKQKSRLILLGDKDQLASVESGAVLVDLIQGLPQCTVELKKTYRFDSGIKRLAESIKRGDSDGALSVLQSSTVENVSLLDGNIITYIGERYAVFMQKAIGSGTFDVRGIFCLFNSFQVLCGVQSGPRGVEGINRRVELFLAGRGYDCHHDTWYLARPVMVKRNDYGLDLFNGDIGICLPDPGTGNLKVWFERPDGTLRGYSPHRLPFCETVFAMTIHKSQGSEFDEAVVVLPEEDNRILSRELIYTAVTRAKKSVKLVTNKKVFKLALSRSIERFSGLTEFLQE